jgi:signal transduction histidine kinase
MGERIRAFDWSATPLGPVQRWPQSLRSAVSILLPSSAQIVLFWGPDLTTIYNDAYSPVLGKKHPRVLGTPARVCWEEIWDVLGPLFTGVLATGQSFWAQDHPFFLERHGYVEETYFDIAYDPVRDESGEVGGIFCIVSETTGRVIGQRRLKMLQDIGEGTGAAGTAEEVCRFAIVALRDTPGDVPWAGAYLIESDGVALLAGSFGGRLPTLICLAAEEAEPLARVRAEGVAALIDAGPLGGTLPAEASRALVLPLVQNAAVTGLLVAGVSPHLALEGTYRDFFDLVASSISTGISRVRALEEERRRAEALTELNRAKTQFFSNVSHEFRTPLTLMLGPIEEARREAEEHGPPERLERVALVQRNALRLLRLVNALLDFSRIEAGRVEASYEPVDLAAVTADLASGFRSTIEGAGLRLIVTMEPPDEPVWIDRDMWEKIVLNLLSNAFKFTFEGEVEVRIARKDRHVELTVRDTGVGIPEADLPHIFERFHRVASTRGRTYEGTGIGLSLVQEVVHLHGGSVAAESALARGTTVTVQVPLGNAHLPPARLFAPRAAPASGTSLSAFVEEASRWSGVERRRDGGDEAVRGAAGKRAGDPIGTVIVADDNADMREYLERLLAPSYNVLLAADGESALSLARYKRPDVVVADIMMPQLDGFGLLRELRSDAALADVPVVLLSARAGEASRVEGLEAGADDYLVKPFSARELLATINAHVSLARMRRLAREQAEAANRQKDEFLATLSHELRTPLNAVLGYVQMLRAGMIDDAARREQILATIDRNARLQVQLLEDVLDVSRITTGKLRLETQPVDLARVLEDAVETIRPSADAKGISVHTEIVPPGHPLIGDAYRLQQVAWNLLSNAVKFTPPGGRVELTLSRPDNERVDITVSDTGTGIAPEFLPRLFERFSQADSGTSREHGGLGLGLAITRHLVELHGGTIRASSPGRGQGTTIHVTLPLQTQPTAAEQASGAL